MSWVNWMIGGVNIGTLIGRKVGESIANAQIEALQKKETQGVFEQIEKTYGRYFCVEIKQAFIESGAREDFNFLDSTAQLYVKKFYQYIYFSFDEEMADYLTEKMKKFAYYGINFNIDEQVANYIAKVEGKYSPLEDPREGFLNYLRGKGSAASDTDKIIEYKDKEIVVLRDGRFEIAGQMYKSLADAKAFVDHFLA